MRIAFSTVACPEWTLERVFAFAEHADYDGVELRTLGPRCADLACDPGWTAGDKVRRLVTRHGAEITALATSARFDAPIFPPVLGRALDQRESIRRAQREVELADDIEAPTIRVFGYEIPAGERRASAITRIAERLGAVCDSARARNLTVTLENGGSFASASQLRELMSACAHPRLRAGYNIAVGHAAGDAPRAALDALGGDLLAVKLKDVNAQGRPVALGAGAVGVRQWVDVLMSAGFSGVAVVEWDRLWLPGLADAETALTDSIARLHGWLGAARSRPVARRA